MRASLIALAKQAGAPAPNRGLMSFKSRMPQSSYYQNAQPGAALDRARRPYLVRNAVTGSLIFAFAIAVYAFTIHAVSQDEFEDVPIPDGPAPAAGAPHASVNLSGGPTAVGR